MLKISKQSNSKKSDEIKISNGAKKSFFLALLFLVVFLPRPAYPQTKIKALSIRADIINPVTSGYIAKGLKAAEKEGSILILIMDTPGGLLKSTEEIVKLLLNSSVPVITYVYPQGGRAASAGVFIGYASHILAMSPSTHIGAAHPVLGGGSWGSIDEEMRKKIMNDTLAWAKNISQTRKRPFSFIKNAIEKSTSITEKQALKKGVCDLIASSLNELIEKIDGLTVKTAKGYVKISTKGSTVEEIGLSARERFLNAIAEPNLAYILLTLGFLGLIFEVTHPGFGFPGIAGIICLITSFYTLSILPVNYSGLALIALGMLLFIVEAFTPTFGMFTLGGAISFFLGSVMLFNQPQLVKVSLKVILPLVITFAGFSLFILSKALISLRNKPITGKEALLGQKVKALSSIKAGKKGKVFTNGEIWTALAYENINKDEEALITEIKGLTLYIRKIKPAL